MSTTETYQVPYHLRTTIDERVAAVAGGCELLAVTLLPRILPLSYQTIKNQIHAKRFALEVIHFNSKNYVRTEDVVRLIWNSAVTGASLRRKSGRKSNRVRAELTSMNGSHA